MSKENITNYLRHQISSIDENGLEMTSRDWGAQEGIIISGDEAKEILQLLSDLPNEPSIQEDEDLEGILLDFTLYLSKRNFTRDYDFEFEKEIKKFLKTNKL